jgi:regulator of nucleoside diphosphate kinase
MKPTLVNRGALVEGQLIVTDQNLAQLTSLRPHLQLQRELDRATVVSSEAVPPDVVTMGSRVRYVDEATGLRRTMRLVYPGEANQSQCKISVLASIGSALLGLSIGQSIEWAFPNGDQRRLRVEDVIYQPESASASLGQSKTPGN